MKGKKCCLQYYETWTLGYVIVGCLLMLSSIFIPRWRVDAIGTSSLEYFWGVTGFQTRQYGLLQVRGSYTQSWSSLSSAVCQFQTAGMVVNAGSALKETASNLYDFAKTGGSIKDVANVTDVCQGSSQCANGFTHHLWSRCHEYEKVWRVSISTICFTFLGVILVLAGVLVSTLTNSKSCGGVTFALYFGGFLCSFVLNVVWAILTDVSFKTLREDAWFPYPSLAIGYFLHLYGTLTVGVAAGCYGYVVLPKTFAYDPEQEKIDKRNKLMAKLAAKKRPPGYDGYGAQSVPTGAMNVPAPPGFQGAPQGVPPQFAGMGAPGVPPQFAGMGGGDDFGMGAPGKGGGPGLAPQAYGHPQAYGQGPGHQAGFGGGMPQPQQATFGIGAGPPPGASPAQQFQQERRGSGMPAMR